MYMMGLMGKAGRTMPMQSNVPEDELEATFELEPPFYVEPIVSWRAWKVKFGDDGVSLWSVTYTCDWPRREELRAECRASTVFQNVDGHEAPHQKHGCGIYSVKSLEAAIKWALHGTTQAIRVIGEVKIWGRILQYSEGYISEYAYPANFYVPYDYDHWREEDRPDALPEELALALEEAFAVPVGVGWPS